MEDTCPTRQKLQAVRPNTRVGLADDPSLYCEQSEPTLKDVVYAVNKCNTALYSLTLHFGAFKEDITHIRHDM